MIRRVLVIVSWLLAGHALLAAGYWGLLNVPESSVWMLALSALLCLVLIVGAGWIDMTAAFAWLPGVPLRQACRRGAAAVPGFVLGLIVYAAIWWAADGAGEWTGVRSGEIDAWLMMRTGSPNTAWVHRALGITLAILRDIVGLSVAVALAIFAGAGGWHELMRTRWLRAAFSRRQIATIGLAVVLLIAMPLRAVYWRPTSLPASGVEVAFVTAKLLVISVLVALGWAYVLRAGMESFVRANASRANTSQE